MKFLDRTSRRLYWAALSAALLIPAGIATAAGPADGDLYAASGANGINGHLYTLDPATGVVVTDFGELHDALPDDRFGITGLAFDPVSHVLYGATAGNSPTSPRNLVRIDPITAEVFVIGPYGITGSISDITFDPVSGVLYGWQSGGDNVLHTLNLLTGAATPVPGADSSSDFGGGGLAMNSAGDLYVTPDANTQVNPTIAHLNPADGSSIGGATLSPSGFAGDVDHPAVASINAMAFDSSDVLFGLNNNRFGLTHLVLIDPTTGVMTDHGSVPDNMDAIAFFSTAIVPEPASTAAFGAVLVGVGLTWLRRRGPVSRGTALVSACLSKN